MSEPKKLPEHMVETLSVDGTTRRIDLWYPRIEGNPAFVEVGLMDVRAADSIRVSYDFERDGWKVEQASTFEWDVNDKVCDPDWKEVAFIQAWARERPEQEPEGARHGNDASAQAQEFLDRSEGRHRAFVEVANEPQRAPLCSRCGIRPVSGAERGFTMCDTCGI